MLTDVLKELFFLSFTKIIEVKILGLEVFIVVVLTCFTHMSISFAVVGKPKGHANMTRPLGAELNTLRRKWYRDWMH